MIQAIRETSFDAYINTEANRINTSVDVTKIRHLLKFTNEFSGDVFYSYAATETISERFTKLSFEYNNTPDLYTGKTKLIPSGYYTYEAYEVSWAGAVTIASSFAPATETDVLTPVQSNKGIVQGLVAIGKLFLSEKTGSEQVQYTQHPEPSGTNYIYYE